MKSAEYFKRKNTIRKYRIFLVRNFDGKQITDSFVCHDTYDDMFARRKVLLEDPEVTNVYFKEEKPKWSKRKRVSK